MSNIEQFQNDGEIRLIKWTDIQDLVCMLVSDMIPFCVVYDKEYVIVRSIDWVYDSGEK